MAGEKIVYLNSPENQIKREVNARYNALTEKMCAFAKSEAARLGIDISRATLEQLIAISHIADPSRMGNVLTIGGSGTGKTWCINTAVEIAKANGLEVLCCAPTNKAAGLIDGVTIHTAFDLPCGLALTGTGRTIAHGPRAIQVADILIVDEISMVRCDVMDAIWEGVKKAEKKAGKPIKLVLVGDFGQLTPVIKDEEMPDLLKRYPHIPTYKEWCGGQLVTRTAGWAFFADCWSDMYSYPESDTHDCNRMGLYMYKLTVCQRQASTEFSRALNGLSVLDIRCADWISKRARISPLSNGYDGVSIFISSWRKEVEKYNKIAMKTLFEENFDKDIEHWWVPTIVQWEEWFTKKRKGNLPDWHGRVDAPDESYATEGMRIVMTTNVYVGEMGDRHVYAANGEQGTIVDVYAAWDGRRQPCDTPMGSVPAGDPINAFSVRVRMDRDDRVITLRPYRYDIYDLDTTKGGQNKKRTAGAVYAMPYAPGYAITTHKAQGSTFQHVILDPGNFAPGGLYVGASRVTSIEGLTLTRPIEPRDMIADAAAVRFMSADMFLPGCLKRIIENQVKAELENKESEGI